MQSVFLGIDVGSASARAGIFDSAGKCLASATQEIEIRRPTPDFVEQSSNNIWSAVCVAVKSALEIANCKPQQVKGVGFDATCSLVVVDRDFEPVAVNADGNDEFNIIMWMDHRAKKQARAIDATKHEILSFTGGKISPEMQLPKVKWLKQSMPDSYERATHLFDLPDWLVFRATGGFARSACSLTCKWTYQAHEGLKGEGWNKDFFEKIGLADLAIDDFSRIGSIVHTPGTPVANGLSNEAAEELGLVVGTPVATSLIDAHAGAVGTLGACSDRKPMALIAGTSACHISTSQNASFVPGVWGPYFSVLGEECWVNEAGQSYAGALLDRIVTGHAAYSELKAKADEQQSSVFDVLNQILVKLAGAAEDVAYLASDLHIQPDFHGNRSPIADPTRKGAIVGLTGQTSLEGLAVQYLAAIQALACGTKHILDELAKASVNIDTLVVSGGLAKNKIYLQAHADVTGCDVLVPETKEPVLLGSAMMGAVAARQFSSVREAMSQMSGAAETIRPGGEKCEAFFAAKYAVIRKMQDDFSSYRDQMRQWEDQYE